MTCYKANRYEKAGINSSSPVKRGGSPLLNVLLDCHVTGVVFTAVITAKLC